MRRTVSTACQQLQATLRDVWASGSAMADITSFLGISKDQLMRLRTKLALPLRLDRSQRVKPKRSRDPTPAEIAAACAILRAQHLEARRAEPPDRKYQTSYVPPRYRIEADAGGGGDDLFEQLTDNASS